MAKRLLWAAVGLVLVFGAAQLIRPARTNPPTVPSHAIQARLGASSPLAAVLDRACNDCHSNATVWSRYTQVAPASWLIASAVSGGRRSVNFSEWAGYSPERRSALMAKSCQEAANGSMPPSVFTLLRPEARLAPGDVRVICTSGG